MSKGFLGLKDGEGEGEGEKERGGGGSPLCSQGCVFVPSKLGERERERAKLLRAAP